MSSKGLFRWAGSKARIMPDLMAHLAMSAAPPDKARSQRWIEPFIGGCSVALEAMQRGLASEYVLGDALPDIAAVLRVLQADAEWLLNELRQFATLPVIRIEVSRPNKKPRVDFSGMQPSQFIGLRKPANQLISNQHVARRFLILQASSFNGLYRTNKAGQYNVPFGRAASFDYKTLEHTAHLLQEYQLQILCQDFAQTIALAGPCDIIYADPPYLGTHNAYSAKGFGITEHKELAACLGAAKLRGAKCWVSGSDCVDTRSIYNGTIHAIDARRSIGCTTVSRGAKRELLVQL